eukprot:SAG11_NODE_6869_length_1233_cov_2.862434_1_plen_163_part_00
MTPPPPPPPWTANGNLRVGGGHPWTRREPDGCRATTGCWREAKGCRGEVEGCSYRVVGGEAKGCRRNSPTTYFANGNLRAGVGGGDSGGGHDPWTRREPDGRRATKGCWREAKGCRREATGCSQCRVEGRQTFNYRGIKDLVSRFGVKYRTQIQYSFVSSST